MIPVNKCVYVLAITLLFSSFCAISQSQSSPWVIGASGVSTSYGDDGERVLNTRYGVQFLKLNATRYLFKGISLDGSVTLSPINEIEGLFSNRFAYFSIDLMARYDFNTSKDNLVPYVAAGFGIVGAPSHIQGAASTESLNVAGGGTFWFSHNVGLNVQVTYKSVTQGIISMVNHIQTSFGLIYSLDSRPLNYRLWDGS